MLTACCLSPLRAVGFLPYKLFLLFLFKLGFPLFFGLLLGGSDGLSSIFNSSEFVLWPLVIQRVVRCVLAMLEYSLQSLRSQEAHTCVLLSRTPDISNLSKPNSVDENLICCVRKCSRRYTRRRFAVSTSVESCQGTIRQRS